MNRNLKALENELGYTFQNPALLDRALTHSSYANEREALGDNERLEFLGDAVLGLICGEYLYKTYPKMEEGELSKLRAALVCEKSLFGFAKEIGLGEEILLGKGEEAGGGRERPSVLSDAFEALLAAIYLDGGMKEAENFVLPFLKRGAEHVVKEVRTDDYKTALQEIIQKNKEETLTYRLAKESGPDHDKCFEVELLINSNVMARGVGKSKRQAEQDAARQALELMGR